MLLLMLHFFLLMVLSTYGNNNKLRMLLKAYPWLFLGMEEQKKPAASGPYAPGGAKGKIKWI